MIATHHFKTFDARLKQRGLCARVIDDHAKELISSKTVMLSSERWASPNSGAEIRKYIDIRKQQLSSNFVEDFSLITEKLVQLKLPFRKKYIAVTPVQSLGILNEFNLMTQDREIDLYKHVVQPNMQALTNHGEFMLSKAGKLRLLKTNFDQIKFIKQKIIKSKLIEMTATLTNYNASAGEMSVGLPALTAIGGFIHAIEAKLNLPKKIKFAVGIKNVNIMQGYFKKNFLKGKKIANNFINDEIKGTCEIVLIIKSKNNLALIAEQLRKETRLAGGNLFNVSVNIRKNFYPAHAFYLTDASYCIRHILNKRANIDSLSTALFMIEKFKRYSICQSGYALLEPPASKKNSRENLSHAFAEPIFNLVRFGTFTKNCFFNRIELENSIFWRGKIFKSKKGKTQ